jgi:hypothetical protein
MSPVTSYTSLEPTNLDSLGVSAPSFDAKAPVSTFATSSFVYSLFFTAIVMAAFYRYVIAGTLRMQASEQSIRLSNDIIKKVTLGLLGVFSLFLILVTVNEDMVSGTVGLDGLLSKKENIVKNQPTTNTSNIPSGEIAGKILTAANGYIGTSTNVPNTNNGRRACAYAVNQILKLAGLKPIANDTLSVVEMKSALDRGRGIIVSQSNAQGGDLVLITSVLKGNHVGVCLNSGCSKVISNSSGNASFSWQSGPDFCPSYCTGVGTIYRVTN